MPVLALCMQTLVTTEQASKMTCSRHARTKVVVLHLEPVNAACCPCVKQEAAAISS
jgi:hypothetical protein